MKEIRRLQNNQPYTDPAPDSYWDELAEIRKRLFDGEPVSFRYAPGNRTSYPILLVPMVSCGPDADWPGCDNSEPGKWIWVVVGSAVPGSYQFRAGSYIDPGYFMGRMGMGVIDTLPVCTMLNDLFQNWYDEAPESGKNKDYERYSFGKEVE